MNLAVGLALAAAACFGLASALQHAGVGRVEAYAPLGVRPLVRLLRDPRWLAGGAADVAGVLLQTAALRYAAVSLVTPLLVGGLVVAALTRPLLDRRRPRVRTVLAAFACAGCLAGLLAIADPRGGRTTLGRSGLLALALAGAALAVAGSTLPRLASTPVARAGILAAGAGALMGLAAVPLRVVGTAVAARGASGLLGWSAVVLVGLGGVGWLLAQNAFHAGPLPMPLAVLTVVEPGAAAAAGRLALHEQVSGQGFHAVVALAALAGIVAAVVVLARGDRTEEETCWP